MHLARYVAFIAAYFTIVAIMVFMRPPSTEHSASKQEDVAARVEVVHK